MKVWPVKHSPLLRQPERFIARSELQALIRNVTQNLVNIKDESGQFLLRLDDGRVIDTKGWAGWEWTHGVGLYGIYQYYQQTGDIEMRDIIDRWFADRFAEGATTKNVNTMAPFLTLAYRFEETGRMAYLPWLESWAEWAMHEMPRTEQGGMQHMTLAEENHQQMWDDTLMMTVLPLAKIGKLLNRPLRPRRPPALPTGFSKRCASVTSGSTTPGWLKKRFAGLCRIFRRRGSCCRPHLAPGWGQTSTFIARSRLPQCPTVRRWRSFV